MVTVAENLRLLRQNSVCVWIERPQDKLAVTDRPLSASGLEALYAARAPLYEVWSEKAFFNGDPRAVAKKIMEDLKL